MLTTTSCICVHFVICVTKELRMPYQNPIVVKMEQGAKERGVKGKGSISTMSYLVGIHCELSPCYKLAHLENA